MKTFLILLPFVISFLIGFFTIRIIFHKNERMDLLTHLLLSNGLGLGISANLTFLSFMIYNYLNPDFVIILNAAVLVLLIAVDTFLRFKNKRPVLINPKALTAPLGYLAAMAVFCIPLYYMSYFYAYGGWDAWSTWNLKAKFLFVESGYYWHNMFDPLLWRSSPHYPLLQPLMNVWGWLFVGEADWHVPVTTSFLLSFSMVSLVLAALLKFTRSAYAIVATIAMVTLTYYIKMSLSQYCDIVIGYYLLAIFICLLSAYKENSRTFSFLAGIFMGLMSFAKGEGLLCAAIIGGLSVPYFLWKNTDPKRKWVWMFLCLGVLLTIAPTIIFKLFYSPGNITFINGLAATRADILFYRLQVVLSFYVMEIISQHWNGFWALLIVGLFMSRGRCFHRDILIIPIFLLIYFTILTTYYVQNTYFPIEWWMQVTLHRIVFSIFPIAVFWTFYSLWKNEEAVLKKDA